MRKNEINNTLSKSFIWGKRIFRWRFENFKTNVTLKES